MFEFVFMKLYNIVSFHRNDSSSDEDFPLAMVAKGVGKLNGDKTDDDDEGDDEDDEYEKEVVSTGKNLMIILVMPVFHYMKDFMLFKITIPNVIILVLILLD